MSQEEAQSPPTECIIDASYFPLQNYARVSEITEETAEETAEESVPISVEYIYGLQPNEAPKDTQGLILTTYAEDKLGPLGASSLKFDTARTLENSINTPLLLRVIDYLGCSNAKSFVQKLARENDWAEETKKQIMGVVPLDRGPRSTLDTGIFLPSSTGTAASGQANTKVASRLIFSISLPYFGLSETTPTAEEESLSLFEYAFRRSDVSNTNSTGERIIVHQISFMAFTNDMALTNDMIAIFRSKEGEHPDRPQPLYPCQGRECTLQVLIHMISNILALSQKGCLIFFNKKVSEKEFEVIFRITNEPSLEDDQELVKSIGALILDIKSAKKVVESQVNVLEDLKTLYGNIPPFIQRMNEQIKPAIAMITEVITEQNSFYRKLDILLKAVGDSKKDLLNRLSEEREKAIDQQTTAQNATIEANKTAIEEQTRDIGDQAIAQQTAIVDNKTAIEEQTRAIATANKTAIEEQTTALKSTMNNQKQIMSMLTILTTIFLPLGFFTSLFGMAPDSVRGTGSFYGGGKFWIVCGVGTAVTSLVTFFVILRSRDREKWDNRIKKWWP